MKAANFLESASSLPKVQKQLVTIFIIILLIPATLCFFLLFQSSKTLNQHYQEQAESDNLRVKSILFDVTTNIYNVSETLATDKALAQLLYASYDSDADARLAVDQYETITNILYKDTSIASLDIYTFNETLGDYSYFHTATDDIQKTSWFTKAASTPTTFWMTRHRTDTRQNMYWELNLFRRIPLAKTGSFAVLRIAISDNYLKNRIDNTALEAVLTVNQDPSFYSSQKKYTGNSFPLEIDDSKTYYSDSGILELGGTKTMAAVSTLVPINSDDMLYIATFDPDAISAINNVVRNYLLMICFILLLPLVVSFVYSRLFSGRILMLRKAMYQASHGNYDIMDSFTGDDEISETFQDLRTMIGEIQKKEAQIYQAQIREKEIENRQQQMEFKMLASQINPHFLYNTLETIRMKAFTTGDREVARAIKLLGKSLRYVLENTGTVSIPLSKEIDYIHTYISIQKLRFGERINFCEKIDPAIDPEEYRILPLMLQPIIENSISHGLEGMESGGMICLEICEKEEFLSIRISDNGKGMTEEELQSLLERINTIDDTRTRSIGLYNINYRLRLCYGQSCQLQMESRAGEGTASVLTLPLNKIKEELTNESSYRR